MELIEFRDGDRIRHGYDVAHVHEAMRKRGLPAGESPKPEPKRSGKPKRNKRKTQE